MKHSWKLSRKRINGLTVRFCVNCGGLKIIKPNTRQTFFETHYLIDNLKFEKRPECKPKETIPSFIESIKIIL